jgi:uncharacterized protein (DUF1499 family)
MKKTMALAAVLAVISLAAAAFVRLAPADPARWHVDVASDAPPLCANGIETTMASARAACASPDAPTLLLARLDATALASPRTRRIAGSPEEGRITWETRSRLMGYPDYTTAQVTASDSGTRLDILARARFGASDWGVNAARLRTWLGAL